MAFVYIGGKYINYVAIIAVEFIEEKCFLKTLNEPIELTKEEGEEFIKSIDKLIYGEHPLKEETTEEDPDGGYQ